ncbi:MAG: molecular chaperone DjiA [Parvularculaceae bacterium]
MNNRKKIWDRIGAAFEEAGSRTLGAVLGRLATIKAKRDESTFSIALIALSAKIAKADGFVTDSEIAAFRNFFDFPESEASKVRMIYDLAKQDVAGFSHYASQVARLFDDDKAVLEDVLDCLLHIALADGVVHPQEMALLDGAAETFGLSKDTWRRLKAAHLGAGEDDPYLILGIAHECDDAALRDRYRNLMRENHPDALMARGVPAGLVKIAEKRTAAINAAYERILAERAG